MSVRTFARVALSVSHVSGYVKSGFSKQFWIIERKAARLLTKFLECFGTDQAHITHGAYQEKAMLVDE